MRNGYATHRAVQGWSGRNAQPAEQCDFCQRVKPPYESVRLERATVRLCPRCVSWVWWYDYAEAGRAELRGLCRAS